MTVLATAGTWDRAERPILFLVLRSGDLPTTVDRIRDGTHRHWLAAVDDPPGPPQVKSIERLLDAGGRVLLDSGIFALASEHAHAHGITLQRALGMRPDQLEGYDALRKQYVMLARRFGDRLWGYLELDLGGRDIKRAVRAELHDLGLRPIPVWHPLSDGADYFDELAATHDRLCIGNLVRAAPPDRVRILHAVWERRRQYPHLWVHALGLNPSPALWAFPCDSTDVSKWMSGIRYGRFMEWSMLRFVGDSAKGSCAPLNYNVGADADAPDGHRRLGSASITAAAVWQRTWTRWAAVSEALCGAPYPAVDPREATWNSRMRTASETSSAGTAPGHDTP
jgi:hypothetical protein